MKPATWRESHSPSCWSCRGPGARQPRAIGLDRADAHRLYLNAGIVIPSHHFARYVKQ
jgi:hypothetical protein